MIVRKEANGEQVLVGQVDHSRLAGQFAAHWGNAHFARPEPYESVVRGVTFHDFGHLRYETSPFFDPERGGTPNHRDIPPDPKRLEEYQWCFDWFLGANDPYAGNLVNAHRTGLWRGRYGVIAHPEHASRAQRPEIDAFIERNEAQRAAALERYGWDPQQLRINYRLLQVWDLMSLYFSCQDPCDDYIEPVPTRYDERDGEGARITLRPVDATTVALDPYPFDASPFRVQLVARRLGKATFTSRDAFMKAFFQAPTELLEWELVDGAQLAADKAQSQLAAAR